VNALLTQLDALRRFPNVLVLTTSNITGAIDLAFVDRADIKAYIGPPSLHARYEILRSCLAELTRAGILEAPCGSGGGGGGADGADGPGASGALPPFERALAATAGSGASGGAPPKGGAAANGGGASSLCRALLECAYACDGFSGRALRKLPFLAHAACDALPVPCPPADYLPALAAAIERERLDRASLAER